MKKKAVTDPITQPGLKPKGNNEKKLADYINRNKNPITNPSASKKKPL